MEYFILEISEISFKEASDPFSFEHYSDKVNLVSGLADI